MKIFRLVQVPSSGDAEASLSPSWAVLTLPDTALLIAKRPFFIPDFAAVCDASLCVAVRIVRLGRSIHRQFAHRYYLASQAAPAVHFIARDYLERLQGQSLPWDMAVGFDDAVAVADAGQGDFTKVEAVKIAVDAEIARAALPCHFWEWVDTEIARVSEHYTLRQGDLFLFPMPVTPQPVHINATVTLSADETPLLSFHVK